MKNDYRRDYFVVNKDATGIKHYYFNLDDQLIEVTKEVYLVCLGSYIKINRDRKKDITANLISYDYINKDGHTLLDAVRLDVDYDKEVLISQVFDVLKTLNHDEQMLIKAFYIDGKTLREMSEEIGIPVMTLHNRKKKILFKLKEKIH